MRTRSTNGEKALVLQLLELEARVRQLERRLKAPKVPSPKPGARTRRHKPRPRCAGCLQELPVGRRGQACVWCGFRFDVVPPIPPKRTGAGRL